jgi:hypothetical protein
MFLNISVDLSLILNGHFTYKNCIILILILQNSSFFSSLVLDIVLFFDFKIINCNIEILKTNLLRYQFVNQNR